MKIKIITLLVLLGFAVFSHSEGFASETSAISSDASYVNTSDNIFQNVVDLSYRNHRRELLYPYIGEAKSAWDFGLNTTYIKGSNTQFRYNGVRAQAIGGRKFSERFHLEAKFGFHRLNNSTTQQTKSIPALDLRGSFILGSVVTGSINASHDFIYTDLLQPGGISHQLTATTISPNLSFRWTERLMTHVRSSAKRYSDDNRRGQIDFSTMIGIATGTPWIWIGLGAERLNCTKTVPTYWSPSQFTSFGPRIEATTPLIGAFSASVGFNGNRFYDKDSDSWGNGYYFSGKLQYGDRNNFNVGLYFIRIESKRNDSKWDSEQVGLNLSIPF